MTTPILGLTELADGQASQGATANQMFRELEGKMVRIISRTVSAQPAVVDGAAYLIPSGATGAGWSVNIGKIVIAFGGVFNYFTPVEGWRVWVNDENVVIAYNGATWDSFTTTGALTFNLLTDTPANKTGAALQFVRVNAGETALEYAAPAGAGDVVGPASATDNAITRYNGTTGTSIQDSGVLVDDSNRLSGHGTLINAQTGTTYTLVGTDNGKTVTLNNGGAITLTIPQQSTEVLPAGFQCAIIQRGAGQVTVAKEGTDTIESKDSNVKLTAQHSAATIVLLVAGAPNTFGLYGDLSA